MEEYIAIKLFKDNDRYKDDVYVAVNGHNCLIKRGEWVKIKPIAFINFNLLIPFCRLVGMINPKDQYRISLGAGFYKSCFCFCIRTNGSFFRNILRKFSKNFFFRK